MDNKKYKNKLIYFLTVIVVIIVYLVIHIYGSIVREDIYQEKKEYENNQGVPPINNIISIEKNDTPIHPNNGKNHDKDKDEDEEDDDLVFLYDYDPANYIDLYNQFPIKDEIGKGLHGDKHTQDFKLKFGKKSLGVKYTITMEKLDGSDLREDWAKAFLVRDGGDVSNCFRPTGRIKTFNEYGNYNDNPKEKILYKGVVTSALISRGYEDYTFRMWVSEDVKVLNEDFVSRTFKTRINVYAEE